MGKAIYKVKGGKMIKIQLTLENKKIIKDLRITGDFFLHPEETIEDIEKALRGCSLSKEELVRIIKETLTSKRAVLLGASPEDLARCIIMAGE
ncbi:biotin--protein ligase [Candidatus Bathyarchaeota archaeon]|nr:biotin--protein ligase [Candidatus Bathyarchaeota archaeon]